ncbi:MAG: helix-turn-helix domain-containing protein [Planctomycetota bacterium]
MAKLFYSLEEAAQRLGKSTDEIQEMAASGQLQEFRDRDSLVFKREQVDLLAGNGGGIGGGDLDGSSIGLADSGMGGIDLGSLSDASGSGSGMGSGTGMGSGEIDESRVPLGDSDLGGPLDLGLEASGSLPGLDLGGESSIGLGGSAAASGIDLAASDAGGLDLGGSALDGSELGGVDLSGGSDAGAGDGHSTGISIFDADETDDSDPAAQTQITDDIGYTPEFANQDAGASGSGLLDLTREADDTSLGADLLDDLYGGSETMSEDEAAAVGDESALFESTGAESDVSAVGAAAGAAAGAIAYQEPYDGKWSGILGGAALGMTLTLVLIFSLAVLSAVNAGGPLLELVASNPWMYVGIAAGAIAICTVVGMVLGKRNG